MATKPLPTSARIANLAKLKQQKMKKIEEELQEQLSSLLAKRKDEIFDIFQKYSALDLDDKLLAGFLIFATSSDNQTHPIISEFLSLANRGKLYQKKSTN